METGVETMSCDATALFEVLLNRRNGGIAKFLARDLRWARSSQSDRCWHSVRAKQTWDIYRVDRAAAQLVGMGYVEAIHSRAGTRYKARR